MKTLIVLLAMAFSVNTYAHGSYLSPTEQTTLAPFFATLAVSVTTGGTTDAMSGKLKQVLVDSQEFRLTGEASVALAQSIRNIQGLNDVSDAEAVDMLVEIAEGALSQM